MSAPAHSEQLSLDAFRGIVAKHGFTMESQDETDYLTALRDLVTMIETVHAMPEYIDARLAATPGTEGMRIYARPPASENPLNAWSHTFKLSDPNVAPAGLLAGRTVATKDTICVAGVPVTCGTQPFHLSRDTPYPVPTIDAPVVQRVLEAGGVITGTSTCENYCISGASFTSATGPVDNPWLKGHSAGGSSSGSAALVAVNAVKAWRAKRGLPVEDLGDGVDFALGGDQGGSIRMPAAFCGIYGLKQTFGLVPYTGVAGLHPMIDLCGPMAGSVRDIAVLLTVMAGYDGIDPRMTPETPLRKNVPKYHEILDEAIAAKTASGEWTATAAAKGLRVGIIKESLVVPRMEPEMAAAVSKAAQKFAGLGGVVEEVSIPLHVHGPALWAAACRGQQAEVVLGNKPAELLSHSMPNLKPPKLDQKWYETMTKYNPAVINTLLFGSYHSDPTRLPNSTRAKAIMHIHQLRAAYDEALSKYDVLITPVTPCVGPPHAPMDWSVAMKYKSTTTLSANTSAFNATGHPALSMPVGWGRAKDGKGKLPIGMQVVGKRWDESTVLFAAAAWEVGGYGLDDDSWV